MTVRDNIAFPLKMAGASQIGDRREGRQRGVDPRPRRAPRPQARQPLRRAAPAGRDGPGDRARAERLPDGRAALQPRREAARADAHRGLADPEPARDHDRLRHPRPDRGDDARRPGRGDAQGRAPAGRQPAGPLRRAGQPVRRRVHRLTGDELHAGRDLGRHREAAVRRGRAERRDPAGGRRPLRHEPDGGIRPEHFEDASLVGDQAGPDLRGRGRAARVDGLRALRLLRHRDRAAPAPSSSTSSPRTPGPRSARRTPTRPRSSRASTPTSKAARGERIELWLDPARIHIFDLDSGRADQRSPRADDR